MWHVPCATRRQKTGQARLGAEVMCCAQIYTASRSALAWTDRLVLVAHNFTDVGQWPRIQVWVDHSSSVSLSASHKVTILHMMQAWMEVHAIGMWPAAVSVKSQLIRQVVFVQRATQTALAVWAALGGRRYAARWATRLQPTLRGLPWRAAAARQAGGRLHAGPGEVVARSAGFRVVARSMALTRAATAPKPLPSVRAAATAAAGAAAAVAAPEASLLGSIGEGLRSTGAVLRAASRKAGSAALAAAAVGSTRLRKGGTATARRPAPVRPLPSVQAPTRRRQQRRAGLLILGSSC